MLIIAMRIIDESFQNIYTKSNDILQIDEGEDDEPYDTKYS